MKKLLIGAAACLLAPTLASAEGFSTADLGSTNTEAQCMDRAFRVFQDYQGEVGAGSIDRGNWTSALYDITTDDYDAIITCAYGPDINGVETTRGTLVVYSNDGTDDAKRRRMAERMKQIWENYE